MNQRPRAVALKLPKIAVDRLPGRKLVRQLPPRAAGAQDIQNGVDHRVHVMGTRASAPLGRGYRRRDQSPLGFRQIRWVWLPFHTLPIGIQWPFETGSKVPTGAGSNRCRADSKVVLRSVSSRPKVSFSDSSLIDVRALSTGLRPNAKN